MDANGEENPEDLDVDIADIASVAGDCPHCPVIVVPVDVEPVKVIADRKTQGGFDILVGKCPRCGSGAAVSGPGPAKLVCGCGTHFELQ